MCASNPGAGRLRSSNRSGKAAMMGDCNDGCAIQIGLVNIFSTDHPATEETAWFIIQLLADFLSYATELFGLCLHWFGIEHFLHYRQVFRQTGGPLLAGTLGAFLFRRGHDAFDGGTGVRLGEQLQLVFGQWFTAGTKDPFDQEVNLLTQQCVLGPQLIYGLEEFLFA